MTVNQLRERINLRKDLPSPASRRALRQAAGLTIYEVAEAVGVSFQAISAYELGTRSPRGKNLEAYVSALRVMREEAT